MPKRKPEPTAEELRQAVIDAFLDATGYEGNEGAFVLTLDRVLKKARNEGHAEGYDEALDEYGPF